jgi:hypothetical protein
VNKIPEIPETIIDKELIIRDLKIKKYMLDGKISVVKSIISVIGALVQKEWIRKDYLVPIEDELVEVLKDLFSLEHGLELDDYYFNKHLNGKPPS